MIHLELFYMVKHSKNTHFSKTKFVFDFHFCFERKCIVPSVFEGLKKKKKNLKIPWVFKVFCIFS